ncbi:MAG TPA: DUF3040 domain-containing protein [Jatrophihabitantaceae bacterium]|nr:DUF3040 domain-containing protein [Jatrophihabitantaceae bacterium]
MALSEYEQRVLEEIEYELAAADHNRLTRRKAKRRIRAIVALVLVVAGLITLAALGLVPGVAATAAAAVVGAVVGAVTTKFWLQRREGLRTWWWVEPRSKKGTRRKGREIGAGYD